MKQSKKVAVFFSNYQKRLEKAISLYREKETTWKYLEASLTLFVIAFFTLFAIRPAVVTISSLVGEIKEKEEISLKMRKKINNLIAAQEEYAKVQEKISVIDNFLPDEPDIAQGISQVLGLSFDNSLSGDINISELSLIGGETESNLSAFNFVFNTKGDYQTLRKFISELTKTQRWLAVERYQIGSEKKKDKEPDTLGLNIEGSFFYWVNKIAKSEKQK